MKRRSVLLPEMVRHEAYNPIISGGMNALRLPGFFENLGHGNVINTSGAALTATSTARLLVRSLCVSHTSAGKLKLTYRIREVT